MAVATNTTTLPTDPRANLAATRWVSIIDRLDAETGAPVTIVMHRARVFEVQEIAGSFCATLHLHDGEDLLLTEGVGLDAALSAVAAVIGRIGHLPAMWSEETDAAERAAAAEVLAASRPAPVAAPAPRIPARHPVFADEALAADPRPATELRRAFKAATICRIAFIRGLGRFVRAEDALAAIEADHRAKARARPLPAALLREELAEALERIVPRHATAGDDEGDYDVDVELLPTDAREAARDLLEHLQARGLEVRRVPA